MLGGSWGVISGVISRVTIVITHIRGLITPLINFFRLEFPGMPAEQNKTCKDGYQAFLGSALVGSFRK